MRTRGPRHHDPTAAVALRLGRIEIRPQHPCRQIARGRVGEGLLQFGADSQVVAQRLFGQRKHLADRFFDGRDERFETERRRVLVLELQHLHSGIGDVRRQLACGLTADVGSDKCRDRSRKHSLDPVPPDHPDSGPDQRHRGHHRRNELLDLHHRRFARRGGAKILGEAGTGDVKSSDRVVGRRRGGLVRGGQHPVDSGGVRRRERLRELPVEVGGEFTGGGRDLAPDPTREGSRRSLQCGGSRLRTVFTTRLTSGPTSFLRMPVICPRPIALTAALASLPRPPLILLARPPNNCSVAGLPGSAANWAAARSISASVIDSIVRSAK